MRMNVMSKTREDHMGIRQMAQLLRSGYPLSPLLQLAIAELVSAAAQAARRTREPGKRSRKDADPVRPTP